MRQAIIGVSIFLGLQIVFILVLFGVTLWEGRQLDRPNRRTAPETAATRRPVPVHAVDDDLPLSA